MKNSEAASLQAGDSKTQTSMEVTTSKTVFMTKASLALSANIKSNKLASTSETKIVPRSCASVAPVLASAVISAIAAKVCCFA